MEQETQTFGGNQPVVDPLNNPMGPPPYVSVQFAAGYNWLDPLGSGNFNIDPQTGFITVTPNQTGIFVFSISVFEWRNGQFLGENRRDFQIHVLNCIPQGQPPVITHDFGNLPHNGDTLIIEAGVPFCYDVTITDPVVTDQVQAYTVSAAFGNGFFYPPAATFTYSGFNPIVGQVCWEPACNYNGQLVPLVIGANDPDDCENNSDVFDTVWVQVIVPPNQPPQIDPDLSGLTVVGDTIIVPAQTAFCYDFTVTDSNLNDILDAYPVSAIFNDPNPPSFSFTGTNPLQGQICWTPDCELEGEVVEITIGAKDSADCKFGFPVQHTLYVKIEVPPNSDPGITSNLNGNIFSNDTIFVFALEDFCFNFTASDPDAGDVLSFIPVSPVFSGANPPVVTTNGSNPLQGQICWEADCSYEGQTVEMIFGAKDPGVCDSIGEAFDTVYVTVLIPPNDAPLISTDLSGNLFSNDTIFVVANEDLCFTFTANDPNLQDTLVAVPLSPVFNDPNAPTFSFSGINPISGQVCWTPDCDYVGQVVPIAIGAQDNGDCSSSQTAADTVYVNIVTPPNDPPVANHNLNGLNTVGDTILIDALVPFCYDVVFTDINLQDTLAATTVSTIFAGNNPATFTVTGINPLQGEICWTPQCENEGQLIEFIVKAEDNGECDNILEAFDTVYVKVSDPVTQAPVITHDLSGTNFVGNTVYMEVGDSICYDFAIYDLTPDKGVNYSYEFLTLGGTNLNLGALNVTTQGDTINGTFCFLADCSNGGSFYRVVIIAEDEATCPPFDVSRDTVTIKVNTDFLSFAGSDTTVCEGSGGVQIGVIPIGGVGPYFYSWGCDNPGGCGISNPYIANPVVNPTDTTTYFVQITDFNGCTSEFDDIVVNVLQQPIVDAGPDVEICEGGIGIGLQCTIVNASAAPGPYTYTWTPAAGLNNPNISNPYANPDTTTIYTVIVESANGCSSLNTTLDTLSTITVKVKERPVVEAGPDREICLGEEVLLTGFAAEAGPSYEYRWTPATGLIDSSQQATLASPPFTTTYFLVAISNGCPSEADSVTLVVHTLPTANPGTAYEMCAGDSLMLDGTASGDSTALFYTYEWTPPLGLSNPNIATPMAGPKATITYTLQATSSFGCKSPLYDILVTVLPKPLANAGQDTVICRGDSIQLDGSHTFWGNFPASPVFYNWTPNDRLSGLFIPDPDASPQQTIQYFLTVSAGSCSTTDSVLISVSQPVVAEVSADTNRICEGETCTLIW